MYSFFDEKYYIDRCYDLYSQNSNNLESFEITNNYYYSENEIQMPKSPIKSINNVFIVDNSTSYQTDLKKKDKLLQLDENKEQSIENQNEEIEEQKELIVNTKESQKEEINLERDKYLPPIQYNYNQINTIFSQFNISNHIRESFKMTHDLSNLEIKMSDKTFLSKKKRNRDKKPEFNEIIKKIGRKKKNDSDKGLHNRNSEDNIIKKIKAKLLYYLLDFINNILNVTLDNNKIISYIKTIKDIKNDEKENLLKDLDYNKIINETKKEKNLDYLKMPLKTFLSQDISPKFSTYSADSNKKIIEKILENEKDNEIIIFIFNLSFGDWLDIFTYKKELDYFGFLSKDNINIIMEKLNRVDKLLDEIYKLKNEDNYFSFFISILYNYERWFFIKKERKRKENNNKSEFFINI